MFFEVTSETNISDPEIRAKHLQFGESIQVTFLEGPDALIG